MTTHVSHVTHDFLPLTFSLKCLFSAVAVRSDATVSLTSFLFSLRSKAKALKTSCCGGRLLEFILDTFCCSFPSFTDCSTWTTDARSARKRSVLITSSSQYFGLILTSNPWFILHTQRTLKKSPLEPLQHSSVSAWGIVWALSWASFSDIVQGRRWVHGLCGIVQHLGLTRAKGLPVKSLLSAGRCKFLL